MWVFLILQNEENRQYVLKKDIITNKRGKVMTYGLVFDGGGARGAFQVGVIKALKELKIDVCAVCGTSIGAINAALFIMDDYDLAYRVWTDIALSDIVSLPSRIKDAEDLFDVKNLPSLVRGIKESRGLDMEPLKNLLLTHLDEQKIRTSNIDFGFVTYSITQKKETAVYLEDIAKGELAEFLLASACFPGFKPKEINNSRFVDGGIINNMPVNMLIDKGIKNIIATDVKGVGFYRDFDCSGKNIITISAQKPILGTMEFDTDKIKKSITEGYLRTKQSLGYLSGNSFFITNESYKRAKTKYSTHVIEGVQCAAQILNINPLKVWDFDELLDRVKQEYLKIKLTNELVEKLNGKRADIRNILSLIKDEQRLCFLVKLLQKEGFEFLKSKATKAMGEMNYYKAASAILYLL